MRIEVTVKDDDGKVIGEFAASNVFPAAIVTACLWGDGVVTVTDDEGNMYAGGRPTQGYDPDQTPMSVSASWKSDGTGFRDEDEIVVPKDGRCSS